MTSEEAIVVLIGGGHASGKKAGAEILKSQLETKFGNGNINIKLIDMVEYMRKSENGSKLPSQFDFGKIYDDLKVLKEQQEYDVIIMYGLYALYDPKITALSIVRVFIDCDADIRLGRWIKRDIITDKAGKTEQEVAQINREEKAKLDQLLTVYLNQSRNEMKLYVGDTKDKADVILPKGADVSGFMMIVDGLQTLVLRKISQRLGTTNGRSWSNSSNNRESVIQNIKLMANEPSVKSLNNDNFSNKNKIYYDVN